MLARYESEGGDRSKLSFDSSLLTLGDERELIKQIALYPEVVARSGADLDPSLLCSFLYELSRLFSRWYHDNPVLKAGSDGLVRARIELSAMVMQVLKNAFALVGIPFLHSM